MQVSSAHTYAKARSRVARRDVVFGGPAGQRKSGRHRSTFHDMDKATSLLVATCNEHYLKELVERRLQHCHSLIVEMQRRASV